MNRHLTATERTGWACGDRPQKLMAHVSACPECQASVTAFDRAVVGFQLAVDTWSAQVRATPPRPVTAWNRMTLAAAAVTFCGVISLGFLPQSPATHPAEDSQLLGQIGAEISRQVPGPMEPLLYLIDGEPTGEIAVQGESR